MKKIILSSILFFILGFTHAQNGLEGIIVEKYYISEGNDTIVNADGGILPVGSVTYRIYVDMLPGYKFQAAYGVPGHELRIETSTLFFNNEDRGATTPTYTKVHAKSNTVMLDSWLSVGAACVGNFGVQKSADDGVSTVVNNDGVLQNTDPLIGIPLFTQDGLLLGTPEPVTTVGISTEIAVFDNQNDGTNGPLFSTTNGSWASLNGSVGVDPFENKVLIAQITTDGLFSFKLNIQLGTPSLGVENYVAENPVGAEILDSTLTYPIPVGVTETSSSKPTLVVYPNPIKDSFKIDVQPAKANGNTTYAVYDLLGNEIVSKNLGVVANGFVETVDMTSFVRGMYLVQLTVDGITTSGKIIKN